MSVSSYFDQAEHNLATAEKMRDEGFYGWSAFVSGQAAEIAVKGVLNFFHSKESTDWESIYGKSAHRIDRLLRRFPGFSEKDFGEQAHKDAEELSKHFISARYPSDPDKDPPFGSYTREDAANTLEAARKLVKNCAAFVRKVEAALAG